MKYELLSELLRGAGLEVRERAAPSGMLPVTAAWLATSCRREDGRRGVVVDLADPDLIEKANVGWFDLACEFGLFDAEGDFLVGVDYAERDAVPILRWIRVRLLDGWDVVGRGAASGILGSQSGYPGFVMLSLDENVILCGTTWQDSVGSIAVPFPHRVAMIREFLGRHIAAPRVDPHERAEAERWFARHPEEPV